MGGLACEGDGGREAEGFAERLLVEAANPSNRRRHSIITAKLLNNSQTITLIYSAPSLHREPVRVNREQLREYAKCLTRNEL